MSGRAPIKRLWRVRYVLRPFIKAFWAVKAKELRWDQKNLVTSLAQVMGASEMDIETSIFEVGMGYLAGVGTQKIPDSLDVRKHKEGDSLCEVIGASYAARRDMMK